MSLIGKLHNHLIYNRRMNLLAFQISALLPVNAKVLDVGCGDGMIDSIIMKHRPDVNITGIDVFVREETYISVSTFDGNNIPYNEESFDAVIFIDVLHHTDNPEILLNEAKRVTRNAIILKDHTKNGLLANMTLRFMDWAGNAHHGVVLPYNYWTKLQWNISIRSLNLKIQNWNAKPALYVFPLNLIFDRSLHFIAMLGK